MKPISTDPSKYVKTSLMVPRARLPDGLEVHEELGKGSNNKVFRATLDGHECVLRAPRRRSDTQQRGSAEWECRHMLKASQMQVGPEVYRVWCARHANAEWPSGLYVLMEKFDHDMDAVLCDEPKARQLAIARRDRIRTAVLECLTKLADELIFVYDIKPSNVMVRMSEDENKGGGVTVRIIDFGRDFCEWAGCEQDPSSRTPIVTMLRKRIQEERGAEVDVDALVRHILFAAMLVIFAATTTQRLSDERGHHRMGSQERKECNMIAPIAAAFLDTMQGRNITLLRHVLRTDEVRGVLCHYHGRRNAGTRRTLRLARGDEL